MRGTGLIVDPIHNSSVLNSKGMFIEGPGGKRNGTNS